MSGTLKPVTHKAYGRQSANVVQSVSVCGPSFCGVSHTVGTSQTCVVDSSAD